MKSSPQRPHAQQAHKVGWEVACGILSSPRLLGFRGLTVCSSSFHFTGNQRVHRF